MVCRVIVVDDLDDTATSLAYLLESLGHEVRVSTRPTEVLNLAKVFRPDLVFLDIGMPELDGWQLCRLLKAEQCLAGMRVFAITGYAMPEDIRRSQEAGFEDHFVKPLDFSRVEKLLQSIAD
jgi:CheY-like chemotaxis protein